MVLRLWGQDNGSSVSVLTNYPNVIAFQAHSHHLINDERTIWQDGFVSIGTGSLYYPSMTPGIERQPYPNGSVRQGLWLRFMTTVLMCAVEILPP